MQPLKSHVRPGSQSSRSARSALNVTHAEAKKRVQSNQTQTSGMLYAAALTRRPETKSVGTQTDDNADDSTASHSNSKPTRKNTETQTETGAHVFPKKPQPKEAPQQPSNPKASAKGGSPINLPDRPGPSTASGDKPRAKSSSRAERPPKGSQDAIKCANRYAASLEDLEMEGISASEHSKPARRSSGGDKPPRTKINFP